MRYFLDEEFIEDGKTIDLVSIALVADDGREYYAQFADANYYYASAWVQEHVIRQLLPCPTYPHAPWSPETSVHFGKAIHNGSIGKIEGEWIERCVDPACPWKKRGEVKRDILAFTDPDRYGKPEFWGYYADYDWVAFCQLFGTMMDLPTGFPMYCRDIKQRCDELGNPRLPEQGKGEHHALSDARQIHIWHEYLSTLRAQQAAS